MEVETKAPTSEDMKAASAAALSAAALKAQVLALREEREIEKLVLRVIELQVQKIQLKMANFSNLEKMLDEEQRKVWKLRVNIINLFVDRAGKTNASCGEAEIRGAENSTPCSEHGNEPTITFASAFV